MSQATRVEAEGKRAESTQHSGHADAHPAAQSEIHAQMDAFRATLKHQALVAKEFSAPDAKSASKLEDLHKSVNRTLDSLTDMQLVDAQKTAHKVTEERKAHHGHSDTFDALRKQQETNTHKTNQDVGMFNAVVLGAAAEGKTQVTENKYWPAEGGKMKSNELPMLPLTDIKDVPGYYKRHPVKPGLPPPIE